MSGSIKLFQFFQKCHQISGIHLSEPNRGQRSFSRTSAIVLISLAQFMFTTVAFLLFEPKSMFDYGFAFYAIISTANTIAVELDFIRQSEKTLMFIKNCEKFIETRAHSTVTYNDVATKIELFNKILCFGYCISAASFLMTVVPYTFIRFYIFDMGRDSFYLFAPSWFPFDWKTPFGYLAAWLAQSAGAISIACVGGQFLNLMFGSCWLFIVIAEDITQDVVEFNNVVKTHENRLKLTKYFCDVVQIYSDAKQRVMDFNQAFNYSLFVFFSWIMLGVSSMLVTIQFELWADDSNLLEIVLLILVLNWMTLFILLLCEPGARMTNQLENFNKEFNRCDWYSLPMELQRWHIIFISNTQNPIKVSSYANITCERETTKKMIHKAFSYFMTLRKFKLS